MNSSTTFKQIENFPTTINYGIGSGTCFSSTDTICRNEDSVPGNGCMDNYIFKSVTHQEKMSGQTGSGLIGLAPNSGGQNA